MPCSTSPRVQPCRVIVLYCIYVQEMATRKTDTKLLQLLASALDTEFTNGDETECFQLDIKSLLPLKAVKVTLVSKTSHFSHTGHMNVLFCIQTI